jgi:hypothetical protein
VALRLSYDEARRLGVKLPKPGPQPLSAAARSRLSPEQLLQVEIVETVRPLLVPGARLIAINQELPGGSRLFTLWQHIKTAMGSESGSPDMVLLWPKRQVGFWELKRGRGEPDLLGHRKARGELSTEQRRWRNWCGDWDYPYAVPRSVQEAVDLAREWGAAVPS